MYSLAHPFNILLPVKTMADHKKVCKKLKLGSKVHAHGKKEKKIFTTSHKCDFFQMFMRYLKIEMVARLVFLRGLQEAIMYYERSWTKHKVFFSL